MRLFVSTRTVATIVRLPPSFTLRALQNKLFGALSAEISNPPLNVLPLPSITLLYALASLVSESIKITTSFLFSTKRIARFTASSATRM